MARPDSERIRQGIARRVPRRRAAAVLPCEAENGSDSSSQATEGLGNDFIVLDLARSSDLDPRRVPALCDREARHRRGRGAPRPSPRTPQRSAAARAWSSINADGSIPEMCGNGLRCVALHVAAARGLRGRRAHDRDRRRARDAAWCPDEGERRPPRPRSRVGVVRLLGDRELDVAGECVGLSIVDAGNPHAVTFRAEPQADLEKFGALIAKDPSFARGTNVEFVSVRGEEIQVFVWERGVRPHSDACGTGACAADGRRRSTQARPVRLLGAGAAPREACSRCSRDRDLREKHRSRVPRGASFRGRSSAARRSPPS